MMRIITTAFLNLVLIGTLASVASANFTYNVSLSVPNNTANGGSAGPVSVNGTITVDKLGSLTALDIVAYSLTFTSPDNPASTVTTSNGEVKLFNASLNASLTSLMVTLAANPNQSNFAIIPSNYFEVSLAFSNLGTLLSDPDRLIIANRPASSDKEDGGGTILGPNGGTYTVGTAVVPEPSSLTLASLGTAIGMGYVGMKRRRTRTA